MRQSAFLFTALAAILFTSDALAQRSAVEIQAYCQRARNTESSGEGNDYPGIRNTVWRCMNGRVYVCEMGASGRGCLKTGHSSTPHDGIRQWCRENPNADFVPGAYMAGSPASWRCRGTQPVVVETEGVDEMGYMKNFWRKVGP